MIFYALLGLFFFKGSLETRCRLHPAPINNTWLINESLYGLCGEDQCLLK